MSREWKRHYFMLNGMEFLVLGPDPIKQSILCADLLNLNDYEKDALLRLVDTDEAQENPILVRFLAEQPYPSGFGFLSDSCYNSWWERLCRSSFPVGLKQLYGFIPTEQFVIFDDTQRDYDRQFRGNSTPEDEKKENIEDILYGRVK